MSAPLRPRQAVHRGHVRARGLLVDKALADVHARILAEHRPGTVVHDLGSRYAVIWPDIHRVDARACIGEPLVELGDALCSACPLAPRERERLGRLDEPCVAWVEAGIVRVEPVGARTRVELGEWIDLDGFERAEVRHLGSPPQVAEIVELEAADADVLLAGARPRADAKQAKVIQALARRLARRPQASGARLPSERTRALGGSTTSNALAPIRPSGPGLLERMWSAFAERVLGIDALARALGLRHAMYLRDTLELFERGELDEALRRAIPTTTLGGGKPRPPSLGLPSPRSSLDIRALAPASGGSFNLAPQLFDHVRATYARAAEQLERAGRIDEAAFVYFELLHDSLAGIALLERHGRHAMAAEIAEARELAPELVVRLWFMAKQPQRAILVARRTGAFAGAVGQLERSHPELADELRLAWATHEAAGGDYVGAIEAVWPASALRGRARGWIDRALEFAGPRTRARLLVQALELAPERLAEIHATLQPALQARTPEARQMRLWLARELSTAEFSLARNALAQAVMRACLRDAGRRLEPGLRDAIDALLRTCPNLVLSADMPSLAKVAPPPTSAGRSHELLARDFGSLRPVAVSGLPDGGALVALGEAGVLQLASDGTIVQRFNVPADALVAPVRGHWALALARRDAYVQIWRLDLGQRSAAWWQDLKLDAWAARHDGGHWFVADQHALFALDLLAATPTQIWRVPLEHERVGAIDVDEACLSVVMGGRFGPELFEFAVPQLVLRKREDLLPFFDFANPPPGWPPMLGPDLIAWTTSGEQGIELRVREPSGNRVLASPTVGVLAATREWLALHERVEQDSVLELRRRHGTDSARVRLFGCKWLACAFAGDRLWGIDDRCRAWSLSLEDGEMRVVLLRG